MSKTKKDGKRGGRCLVVAGGTLSMLMIAAAAQAQVAPEPLVSRDVGYFAAGVDPASGGSPIQAPNNYPASAATCGQAKVAVSGTVTNPTTLRFDDPSDVSRDCVVPASTVGGALASVPFGTGYRAAARSRGANTVSAWSALSNPFDVARVPPAVPTGVRVQ